MSDIKSPHHCDNLPADATSFVDRHREVSEVKRLLTASRLLTLTGVGGVGKTRLAVKVAAGLRRAFADGVWLVELAVLQDHTLLEQTVADTVGLRDRSARSPREVVLSYLRDKQLLLVLDNCEHLAERCARLAADLLAAAPGLRILATSRHALATPGEQILAVPPLPLPDPESTSPPGKLVHNEAIQLFAERAALVRPGFAITAGNRGTVARICRRLDGLPLAIELAAARLRVLSPEQILHRLDDRFRFLQASSRAVLPRHRALRAVVDWSYELCSPPEQQLWARVSVFAGGFDLDAAEAVGTGDGIDADQVLDLVTGLVDKSILIKEDQAHGLQARYHLLDTLRHYGREVLQAAGAEPLLRRKHRDYYLDLAERGETEWFGPTQLAVAARVRCDHANLRLALEFCLSTPGESQTGLRLAGILYFYWIGCGLVAEGRHWLDRMLARDGEPSRARATALAVDAHLAVLQGDISAGAVMAQESRDWAQREGEETVLAYALFAQGSVVRFSGDLPRAQTLLADSLARFETLDRFKSTAIIAYVTLAGAAVAQGDLTRAVALGRHARALCEQRGEQWSRAYTFYALSLAEWKQGELAQATTHAQEGLRIFHAFNDTLASVLLVERLAWITGTAGHHERAATLLGVAGTMWSRIGGEPLFGSQNYIAAHEACEQQARLAIGDRAFQAAFDDGAGLDLDQAVAYALGERTEGERTESATAAPTGSGTVGVPLTRRERQVAELVAQGLSNKDIAARLVIAPRTAESHVGHVLTKLGLSSRTQLVAWLVHRKEDGPGGGA